MNLEKAHSGALFSVYPAGYKCRVRVIVHFPKFINHFLADIDHLHRLIDHFPQDIDHFPTYIVILGLMTYRKHASMCSKKV